MTSSSCIFINLKKKKTSCSGIFTDAFSNCFVTILGTTGRIWVVRSLQGALCGARNVPIPNTSATNKMAASPPQPTRGGVGMALLGVYLKWRVPGCMEVFGNLHPWFEASEQKPKITGMNKTPMIRTKVVWRAREYSKAVFSNQKLRENLITVLKEHLDCTWKENYIYHIPSTLTNGQIEIKIHEFELFSYSFFLVKWSLSKLPFLKSVFY